jgi:nicotinamidase-related amidase
VNPLRPAFTHANLVSEEKNPMPLTTLDPNTALIVIDLQKGIVNGTFIHPIGDIIDRTRALIGVFRAKNLPVVLVNVAGRAPGRKAFSSAATNLPRNARLSTLTGRKQGAVGGDPAR